MTRQGANRVFWLGMHKLLTRTELPRLRRLGFEVFNPPYLSAIYDQSANYEADWKQPTTLPPDVFRRLMSNNFFYSQMPADIAELLNAHFSTVIVTINLHWLKPVLRNFRGRVIFRLYGQHFSIAEQVVESRLWREVMSRDDFHIVPFSPESIEREHTWFLDLCRDVVPYHIDEDVSGYTDTWDAHPHRREIMATMPNIDNPYFEQHYRIFNDRFPQSYFKLYGVQRSNKPDPRIVGTLDRSELLRRFQVSSGYYYHFRDQVCYLPPIEMMEVGGPVLYAPDSLLARFYEPSAPGLCRSIYETQVASKRLLNGDQGFVRELQAAQRPVRDRYRPAKVNPVFDRVFARLLDPEGSQAAPLGMSNRTGVITNAAAAPSRRLIVALHVNGLLRRNDGKVFASEGIPRVVDVIIDAVIRTTDVHIVVTCRAASADIAFDFFSRHVAAGRLSIHVLDPSALRPDYSVGTADDKPAPLEPIDAVVRSGDAQDVVVRMAYKALCDSFAGRAAQLVPHFCLFPEAALTELPLMLYLPDYYPHLFPGTVFDSSAEKDAENERVGRMLVSRATFVLTNSRFTQDYLPKTALFGPDDAGKVRMLWLPLLGEARTAALDRGERSKLEAQVGGGPYLFYPTANRPNKQIAFLLRVFAIVRERHPALGLVLTGDLNSYPAAAEAAAAYGLTGSVVLLSQVSESGLRWLYEQAAALCLTSTMEGNFPPQLREALSYGAPIVATRLPMIVEILGEWSNELLLCDALDLDGFVGAIEIALARREQVLERQRKAADRLRQVSADQDFDAGISSLIDQLILSAAPGPPP